VLRKERITLGAAVTTAIEASRPVLEAARHQLTVDLPEEPLYVDGDLTRLAQVVGNLLNNAAKYTDPDGRVSLLLRREGSDGVISVRDNGIGVAPEHLSRLFGLFSQLGPALERSQGGLGIGLALVKGLVELHGGRVEARSEGVGFGSEFVVRLPLVVSLPHDAAPISTVVSLAGPRRRVLVADDNQDAAESLGGLLEALGHEVRVVRDGQAAVEEAAAFRPEVALLDIGMPRMNGY
jgi:CheY-like chemotaxis protein